MLKNSHTVCCLQILQNTVLIKSVSGSEPPLRWGNIRVKSKTRASFGDENIPQQTEIHSQNHTDIMPDAGDAP